MGILQNEWNKVTGYVSCVCLMCLLWGKILYIHAKYILYIFQHSYLKASEVAVVVKLLAFLFLSLPQKEVLVFIKDSYQGPEQQTQVFLLSIKGKILLKHEEHCTAYGGSKRDSWCCLVFTLILFLILELLKCFGFMLRHSVSPGGLVEGVGVWTDHHDHFLEGIGSSSELSPVDSILVPAPIVTSSVPNPVQVGVGTRVVPPASLLVVGTVSWKSLKNNSCQVAWKLGNIVITQSVQLSKYYNPLHNCFLNNMLPV